MPQGGGNIVLTLRLLAKIIFALVSAEMSKLTAFKQRHFYGRSKIISLRQQSNASAQYHRRPAARIYSVWVYILNSFRGGMLYVFGCSCQSGCDK